MDIYYSASRFLILFKELSRHIKLMCLKALLDYVYIIQEFILYISYNSLYCIYYTVVYTIYIIQMLYLSSTG